MREQYDTMQGSTLTHVSADGCKRVWRDLAFQITHIDTGKADCEWLAFDVAKRSQLHVTRTHGTSLDKTKDSLFYMSLASVVHNAENASCVNPIPFDVSDDLIPRDIMHYIQNVYPCDLCDKRILVNTFIHIEATIMLHMHMTVDETDRLRDMCQFAYNGWSDYAKDYPEMPVFKWTQTLDCCSTQCLATNRNRLLKWMECDFYRNHLKNVYHHMDELGEWWSKLHGRKHVYRLVWPHTFHCI